MTRLLPLIAILGLSLGTVACDDKKAETDKKAEKKDDKKGADAKKKDDKAAPADAKGGDAKEPAPAADDSKVAPPSEPPPAAAGPEPSNDKEFLGLELPPMGKWKPVWDADAKVAKWEDPEIFSGIIIRVVSDKLESMDDLKAAAPMMMQIGTAISKVDKDVTKTDHGWWSVVSYDEDKLQTLIYVRKFGNVTTVCSASLKSSMGDPIKEADAMKACESYKVKA
jgi:hypothetical protein